jgi:hypothetical protein
VLRDLEIVDTPGTNSIERMEEEITRGFVPRADLVLFVTSLLQPLTASELAFLSHIREWGKKVIFVVNGVDRRNSNEQIDRVRDYLTHEVTSRLGGPAPTTYFVSALAALRARVAARAPAGTASGPRRRPTRSTSSPRSSATCSRRCARPSACASSCSRRSACCATCSTATSPRSPGARPSSRRTGARSATCAPSSSCTRPRCAPTPSATCWRSAPPSARWSGAAARG